MRITDEPIVPGKKRTDDQVVRLAIGFGFFIAIIMVFVLGAMMYEAGVIHFTF